MTVNLGQSQTMAMKHMKLGLQEEPFLKSKSSATAQEKAGKTVWAEKKLVTGKK